MPESEITPVNNENTPLTDDEQLLVDFPPIELAYDIAVSSYDAVLKRIDSLDGRIQTMATLAIMLWIAVPTIAKTQNQSLNLLDGWFLGSISALVFGCLFAALARFQGEVQVLSPEKLYKHSLYLPTNRFKLYLIEFAGEDFKRNKDLLAHRWGLSILSMLTFFLSLVLSAIWVAKGSHS